MCYRKHIHAHLIILTLQQSVHIFVDASVSLTSPHSMIPALRTDMLV